MASQNPLDLGSGGYSIPLPTTQPIPYLITAFLLVVLVYNIGDNGTKLPEINPLKPFEFTNRRRMGEFIETSKELMLRGRAVFGSNLYKMTSPWGEVVVLPPELMHEVRNDPKLDLMEPVTDDAHGYVPGFDPFKGSPNTTRVINKYLTKSLGKITRALSEEATRELRQVFSDSTAWHEMLPQDDIIRIISRLSSRVFMGEELCRDEEWVRVCGDYTSTAFSVASELGRWPRWARPFVHWFLPSCWHVRKLLAECRKALQPHLDKRESIKSAALARGETGVIFDDSIEWFKAEAKTKYDPAIAQISLSLVAIHTTSDLLQQCMIDLASNPELFEPLREEVIRVFSTEGFTKTALYNLKLMDSVFKETQRIKPVLLSTWRRTVQKDIKLSTGFILRKGQKVIATNTHMWDSNYHENPLVYNGYRFFNMHNTEEEKQAHLVSTSARHPAFGHGHHACPGRFFATHELKVAMAHMLLKYEWKLPDGANPQPIPYSMTFLPDPTTKLLIRRRKEEIDLDSLEF